MTQNRVLVIGYRKPLCRALEAMEISYDLWSEKIPQDKSLLFENLFVNKIYHTRSRITSYIENTIAAKGPYQHVISAGEKGVFAAVLARRNLDARCNQINTVLRCYDKWQMKQYLQDFNIPMAKIWDASMQIKKLNSLPYPVVLKDRKNSGGRGITIIRKPENLRNHSPKGRMIESFVKGTEFSVETFVQNGDIQFTNITEYYVKKYSNVLPAKLLKQLNNKLLTLNEKVIQSLNIQWGMLHAEYYYHNNRFKFGEIALRPPGGYIMHLMELAYSFNPWEAYVCTECDIPFDFPKTASQTAGSCIFHPGEGTIYEIKGQEKIQNISNLKCFKLKAKVGDQISTREGVGEDIGYSFFVDTSTSRVKKSIDQCRKNLIFLMRPIEEFRS